MKILLILLAVIVGLPVYAFVGFLVFVAAAKICDGLDGDWRCESWRWFWREDEGTAMLFLALWPFLASMGIVVLPFYGVYHLINKLLERRGSNE
jgi:hypothetical protein